MAGSFDVVGTACLAKSGRSVKLELNNLPHTVFTRTYYIGINDLQAMLTKAKKMATVYVLKPKERNESCEAHKS